MPADGNIIANDSKKTFKLSVSNTGDRPIQVGSHTHFAEANKALEFDREKALGYHLNISSGTSIRFEPGESKHVEVVEFGGTKTIFGFSGLVSGELESKREEAIKNIHERGIKSVLENDAKAVYQGKIYVSSKAQKTDGYQLSKAILLDETTEFNAKPELEIYADDVKCSHGSASGSLNENSIFYLMSRGLNYKEAKELLISGFLLDVIEKITDSEIKSLIKKMIGLQEWK